MDQINRALTAVAGVLGLVYLFGMGAVALRLTLNHLPLESVVTQLTQPYLLVLGLEVVLPVVLVAAICTMMIWLRSKAPFERGDGHTQIDSCGFIRVADEDKQMDLPTAGWALVATLVLVGGLVLAYESVVTPAIITDLQVAAWGAWLLWLGGPLALLVVVAGIAWALFGGSIKKATHKRPYRRTVTLTAISVVAGTALLVWGGISGTRPLDFVKVCPGAASTARASAAITGTLVASSGGQVLVANYPAHAKPGDAGTVEVVSGSDIVALYVGTDRTQTYGQQNQCATR